MEQQRDRLGPPPCKKRKLSTPDSEESERQQQLAKLDLYRDPVPGSSTDPYIMIDIDGNPIFPGPITRESPPSITPSSSPPSDLSAQIRALLERDARSMPESPRSSDEGGESYEYTQSYSESWDSIPTTTAERSSSWRHKKSAGRHGGSSTRIDLMRSDVNIPELPVDFTVAKKGRSTERSIKISISHAALQSKANIPKVPEDYSTDDTLSTESSVRVVASRKLMASAINLAKRKEQESDTESTVSEKSQFRTQKKKAIPKRKRQRRTRSGKSELHKILKSGGLVILRIQKPAKKKRSSEGAIRDYNIFREIRNLPKYEEPPATDETTAATRSVATGTEESVTKDKSTQVNFFEDKCTQVSFIEDKSTETRVTEDKSTQKNHDEDSVTEERTTQTKRTEEKQAEGSGSDKTDSN